MSQNSCRILTLAEALGLAAYIAWYIWDLQASKPYSWIVFPIWLLASIALHRDTPKALGWRADNLWPATRQGLLIFIGFVVASLLAGLSLGAFHRLPHSLQWNRFFSYAAFCLLQQVALNSYLTNRLLYVFENNFLAALVTGAIFSAMHWPNPVLVPLTFIGGVVMGWLFARQRNIIPLAVGQAIIGTLVWWAFPVAWHHGMRVGPGYYNFHP
ncbi:MAG TPA: CPBP family intramembrane glutamic endopeptidase [Candidatus Acidoferrum sp.]|nr:CPBP family intramembrane glutamic endopeptidase [Candidatus Acidoferrum sp.]